MTHLLLIVIYLSFISLGLPDSLLGAAWPSMQPEFGVPVSWAGPVSMTIAAGTIVSSLLSDRLTRKLGAGKVTAVSVGMTAAALFGFSLSHSYPELFLWAVPYGLGAGGIDAALNNYVALHYESRHMSWLHCFWGVGASIGPAIMGLAITGGLHWNGGYRIISILQILLTVVIIRSLPLWEERSMLYEDRSALREDRSAGKPGSAGSSDGTNAADVSGKAGPEETEKKDRPLSLGEILRIPGTKAVMLCFFCYCAVEQTTGLWAGTYLVQHWGVNAAQAASLSGLFFLGITAGRAVSGFATRRCSDDQLVRIGQGILLAGILMILLPVRRELAMAGFIAAGLGCAPVYPSLIHATPGNFGAERSQAIIGVQMASAYVGTCLMPPLFGLLAGRISISLLPFWLLALLTVMFFSHERLNRICR